MGHCSGLWGPALNKTDNPCPGEAYILVGRRSQKDNINNKSAHRTSDDATCYKENQSRREDGEGEGGAEATVSQMVAGEGSQRSQV